MKNKEQQVAILWFIERKHCKTPSPEKKFYYVCFGLVLALSPRSQQVSIGTSHPVIHVHIHFKELTAQASWTMLKLRINIFKWIRNIANISAENKRLRPQASKNQLVDDFHYFSFIHASRLRYIRSLHHFPSTRVLYRFTIFFYVFSLSYRRALHTLCHIACIRTQQDKDFNSMAKHKTKLFTGVYFFQFQRRCF